MAVSIPRGFRNIPQLIAMSSVVRNKSPSAPILQKGSACLNCRRRKIRCDGHRPICGPCATSDAFRDCEYTDGGQTRTQVLESQISALQQRINLLERPTSTTGSASPSPPQYGEALTLSHLPYSSPHPVFHESALQIFLSNCNELGFFLNVARFRDAALSQNQHAERPIAALINVVYLWSAHLTPQSISATEQDLLPLAVQCAAQGLSSNHRYTVIQSIQAEVLLANYFFRNARALEGNYHISAAMSLVISSKLHLIRSADPPATSDAALEFPHTLRPAADPIEEGERINGFWTVIALNNCWAAADGSPFNLLNDTPGGRIDLPWPLDMNQYSQSLFPPHYSSSRTTLNFLDNHPDNGTSCLALYAKASILMEQASRTGDKYRHNMSQGEAASFFARFSILEQVILRFTQELPSAKSIAKRTSPAWALLVYSLAHGSMIKLHAPFISRNPASRSCIVASIRPIVHLLQNFDLSKLLIVDASLGIVWAMICEILIQEISIASPSAANEPRQLLDIVMSAMQCSHSPYIDGQLESVRHLRSNYQLH